MKFWDRPFFSSMRNRHYVIFRGESTEDYEATINSPSSRWSTNATAPNTTMIIESEPTT